MNQKEVPNFPYAGNAERYQKWEKEPVEVVNVLNLTEKEKGYKLPRAIQSFEGNELTPEQAVDIDNRALRNPDCPNIVFGRPHGGEYIPKSLLDKIDREAYGTLAMIDRGTAEIFRSEKIPSVGTKISRLFVDPNRPPLMDMDSGSAKAIGKVLWLKGIYGEDMYEAGKLPTEKEIEDLVERFYLPYYNGMMGTIGSLADRETNPGERILVVDGHSFPVSNDFKKVWEHYEVKDITGMPLFIIGDREGTSCDPDIRQAFIQALENNFETLPEEQKKKLLKYSSSKRIIGVNEYMKGVHNVQFYGQKQEGVSSIQLELNESAYVDEKDGNYYDASYNDDNLQIIKKLIEKTCLDVNPLLKNKH